jgi:hypothetical protein
VQICARRASESFALQAFTIALIGWLRALIEKNEPSYVLLTIPRRDRAAVDSTSAFIGYGDMYDGPNRPDYRKQGRRSFPRRSVYTNLSSGRKTRGNCHRCGKPGHWQAQCTERKAVSHLDALRSRVKAENGDAAKVLFAIGEELYAIENEQGDGSSPDIEADDLAEAQTVFQEFFNVEDPQDFPTGQ